MSYGDRIDAQPWTAADVETLRRLLGLGVSHADIAERLGRTPNSVQKKAVRINKTKRAVVPSSSWTPERVAEALRMWGEGMSALQIANALGGVTRNAVIGKLHRCGATQGKKQSALPAKKLAPAPVVVAAPPAPEPELEPEPELIVLPVSNRVTLLDLEPDSCRYPIWGIGADTLFCGKMKQRGSSYCPSCHAIAWVKPTSNFQRVRWPK